MLTHKALAGMVRDVLGVSKGQSLADGYSVTDVINHAGRWLTASHQWAWLSKAVTTLNYVSGLEYISLPADFRSIGAVTITNGLVHQAHMTTMDVIVRYRTQTVGDLNDRWLAVSYRPGTEGGVVPVLEVYPTPSAAQTAALTLYYSADWTELTEDGYATVPAFMEPLVIEAARQYALGLAAEGGVDTYARMDALKQSQFFMSFRRRDGQVQNQLGPLLHTAGNQTGSSPEAPFSGPIPNPS
ncbi:MAG: hypothetical protein OSB57_04190 [Planctomycetota bacterium]|nr:hypothetical protein [Planctomycetota bacterium]